MTLNQSPVRLRRFHFLSLRGKGDDSLAAGRPLRAVYRESWLYSLLGAGAK